jgi:hypothetical protein
MVTATLAAVPAAGADPASAQCPTTDGTSAGTKVAASEVPVVVAVTDSRTGAPTDVTVTFSDDGTRFYLSGPDPQDHSVVVDGSWCVKAVKGNTVPVVGAGASGASPASNKKGDLLRIDYVTLFTVIVGPQLVVCLDSSTPGAPDVEPVGQFDTKGNLAVHGSTDGTCSGGEQPGRETMVSAGTRDEANAKCLAAGEPGVDAALLSYGYPLPQDVWVCARA